MAKTAGTTINGLLAHHYERVCGNKGYSYDAYRANLRHKAAGGGHVTAAKDSVSKLYPGFNRLRVPPQFRAEIGYEDCDYVSQEGSWTIWPAMVESFKAHNFTFELHVPCRDPLEHLMSMANYRKKTMNCSAVDLEKEVARLVMTQDRFSKKLLNVEDLTLRCFDPVPPIRYDEYMGHILQRKRIDGGEFVHRSTNRDRNRAKECIWKDENHKLRENVVQIMYQMNYFSWCNECLDSDLNIFAEA